MPMLAALMSCISPRLLRKDGYVILLDYAVRATGPSRPPGRRRWPHRDLEMLLLS